VVQDICRKKKEYMLGFWFSVVGLLFGVICSLKAKKKNRTQHDWFILGFLFSVLAYLLIYLLRKIENIKEENPERPDPSYQNAFITT